VVFSTGGYNRRPRPSWRRAGVVCVVLHDSMRIAGGGSPGCLGRLCSAGGGGLRLQPSACPRCRPPADRHAGSPGLPLLPCPLPRGFPLARVPLLLGDGGSQGALGLNRMVRPLVPSLLACWLPGRASHRLQRSGGRSDPRQRLCGAFPSSDELAGLLRTPIWPSSRSGRRQPQWSWPSCGTTRRSWCRFPRAAIGTRNANRAAVAAGGP